MDIIKEYSSRGLNKKVDRIILRVQRMRTFCEELTLKSNIKFHIYGKSAIKEIKIKNIKIDNYDFKIRKYNLRKTTKKSKGI